MDSALDDYRRSLINALSAIHTLSGPVKIELTGLFKYVTFQKKEIILRPGDTAGFLYYVIEGFQRSYLLKDKEYTIAFSYAPGFCAVPDSFLLQRPSKHYLESITASKMLAITYDDLKHLIEKYQDMERLMRIQHERMIVGLHDRQTELMSMNMEERFQVFCERSFHLFANVPHKYIASYLNIDPTNLSKLLNK